MTKLDESAGISVSLALLSGRSSSPSSKSLPLLAVSDVYRLRFSVRALSASLNDIIISILQEMSTLQLVACL